jgi:hypothetical protein
MSGSKLLEASSVTARRAGIIIVLPTDNEVRTGRHGQLAPAPTRSLISPVRRSVANTQSRRRLRQREESREPARTYAGVARRTECAKYHWSHPCDYAPSTHTPETSHREMRTREYWSQPPIPTEVWTSGIWTMIGAHYLNCGGSSVLLDLYSMTRHPTLTKEIAHRDIKYVRMSGKEKSRWQGIWRVDRVRGVQKGIHTLHISR